MKNSTTYEYWAKILNENTQKYVDLPIVEWLTPVVDLVRARC